MAETNLKYDVFISYSSVNKDWVRKDLLTELEKAGLKVCIDFRDFKPGKPAISNIRDSILASNHTLLVLTDSYLTSGWTDFENLLSQTIDPANRASRIIPLLRENCNLPLEIKYLTYVNFFDPDDWDIAWKQLFEALSAPDVNKLDTSTENELKLIASEKTQAKMLASIRGKDESEIVEILRIVKAALNLAEFDISQENVEIIMDEYFDTGDLLVYKSRTSFRVRRSRGKIEVTVKTPKEIDLGLFKRQEGSLKDISEERYSELVKTGFQDVIADFLPSIKSQRLERFLRLYNERRSFSLKRRDEVYVLSIDLFTFINPRTGKSSEENSEVEIEARNSVAQQKLGDIRFNLIEIVKGFDLSTDSKYERGIKYFGIDTL